MHNARNIVWIAPLFIFARLCGFCLFSPFFSGKMISFAIRIGLACGLSLIIAPPLLSHAHIVYDTDLQLALYLLKEIIIGYLIGWVFSLLFEAAALAGQMIGTLMGFSATELLVPPLLSEHTILSRFFLFFSFTVFFTLDLHHPLLRLIFSSYQTFPIQYPFTQKTIFGYIQLSNQLFHQAIHFAFFPLTILLLLITLFAILSRFFAIFWVGFPLQILAGLTAIAVTVHFFSPLLERLFFQSLEFFKNAL